MSNAFSAADMVKLSTDSIEGIKFVELENCKSLIRLAAKEGEREVHINIAPPVRNFVLGELESLGFKVELGPNVMISW